ncbi:hypothetical protein JCM24511_07573 [Saitozyma sp. JCM 24511]|nr:hypothetical protein JCM24511_07573 [Saitozyma sp. JCM 24511]
MARPDSYSFPASSSSNPYRYSTYEDQRPLHEHAHDYPARSEHRGPPQVHPLYHDGPEDQDEAFDVRADFDGDGPRWSERYGSDNGKGHNRGDSKSYRPVEDHVAPAGSVYNPGVKNTTSREELVSVPVLGPEWDKSELHDLSRRGQAEIGAEKRRTAWLAWTRDQRGICGVRWLTRRVVVFGMFVFCAALAVTLYFTIPRPAAFSFYEPAPFTVDNSTIAFSRSPTNFSFSGNLQLLADTSSAYLPTHFTNIQATVYDLNTNKQVATGNYGNHVVPKGQNEPVTLPVTFSYTALNTSDTTWNDYYDACGHIWTGTVRPDLKLRLVVQMSILGLVGHPEASTQISDVTCPFELPANSV